MKADVALGQKLSAEDLILILKFQGVLSLHRKKEFSFLSKLN